MVDYNHFGCMKVEVKEIFPTVIKDFCGIARYGTRDDLDDSKLWTVDVTVVSGVIEWSALSAGGDVPDCRKAVKVTWDIDVEVEMMLMVLICGGLK